MWERFTENSRRVVFFAQEEASNSGASEVTSEHFLLALLRDRRSFAARVLADMVSDLGLIHAGVSITVAMAPTSTQPLVLTESAQRAFAIAADEARRQNYKNVGPEHLLLGIIGEGASVSARVLMQYGVDADRTRAAISKLRPTQFATGAVSPSPVGPAAVTMKVRPPARFTDRARQILVFAREEARRFHSASVETEHMLLGLIRDDSTVAVRVLVRVGVPLATLQAEIQRQMIEAGLQSAAEAPSPSRSRLERLGVNLDAIQAGIQRQVAQAKGGGSVELELTVSSKTAIDLACDEAERLSHNFVGTEHLLLGLTREATGLAARALLLTGVDLDRTRNAVAAMHSEARARLLQDNSPFAVASRADGVIFAGESGGSEAAHEGRKSPEGEAAPGDLGVAKTNRHRAIVEVACDRATHTQLAAILATKDAHGYRALAQSEDALFLIPDATELKLLLPPDDADKQDPGACYVRILSGEFAGRAGWILRRAFRWTGPDDSEFLPEI